MAPPSHQFLLDTPSAREGGPKSCLRYLDSCCLLYLISAARVSSDTLICSFDKHQFSASNNDPICRSAYRTIGSQTITRLPIHSRIRLKLQLDMHFKRASKQICSSNCQVMSPTENSAYKCRLLAELFRKCFLSKSIFLHCSIVLLHQTEKCFLGPIFWRFTSAFNFFFVTAANLHNPLHQSRSIPKCRATWHSGNPRISALLP